MRSTCVRFAMRFAMLCVVLVGAGVWTANDAEGQRNDPAARGLDLYIHAPASAAPGGAFELVVEAFGFPTVTHAVPLPGATVEAGWDPEKLDGQAAPPTVTVKTDAGGRAKLVVPMPDGVPADLSLLVDVRHGEHVRSHALTVKRAAASSVELHVADSRVVPTSTISAWVRVVGVAGQPLAGAPVVVALEEGGVARHRAKLTTDKGGMAMARVPIPRIDEPVWSWTLSATVDRPGALPTKITLVPREENPGTPVIAAAFDAAKAGMRPGEKSKFSIRVLDATGAPVADQRVTYWIGARGVEPPKDDAEWKKTAVAAVTDGAGTVSGSYTAPTLVRHGGTAVRLIAKTELEGHEIRAESGVAIGNAAAALTVSPEVDAVVPGISQHLAINVVDGKGQGVEGTFEVSGDGLNARVKTNADGDGDVVWNVPAIVGASRNTGPCAGGVAAAVTVRPVGNIPALAGERDAFVTCVSVDRDAEGIVRIEPTIAKPGEKVKVTLTRAKAGKRGASILATSAKHPQAMAAWLDGRDDGSAVGELTLPADAGAGPWTFSLSGPDGARAASVATTSLFVVPTTLPLLEVKRTGGRAAPGGKVEIEARLTDGHGNALQGSVSAVVVDAFGGGSANVSGLDTRTSLCGQLGHPASCDLVLERDPSTEAFRKTLGSRFAASGAIRPINDPGAHASEDLTKTFGEVLRSLEGAVFEAAHSPETLLDVARKDKASGRWTFNPELLTLATEAMPAPPVTPGGEKLTLADLVIVDPQVTFDNVARRITRLKLFRVLAAVRQERNQRNLDPDEPVFKDPNALVRRLVRKGTLTEDALLDPWGGTIQFVRSPANAAPVPFINVIRGWELHAPGPDGVVATADDVRDPFERVVRSGSPYAKATDEDKLVDARWDMVVSEETVNSWQTVLEDVTGTQLGGGGLGMTGVGEGGGGSGGGIGLGNVGTIGHGAGTGRASTGISSGDAYWVAPIRTDVEGRVRLAVPLGDVETTWQIALIGVADGGGPATATLDVPSDIPLSARVAGGARWVEGDVVDTDVIVRNRGATAARARVSVEAEGAATIEGSRDKSIDVPAHGARSVHVRVRATRPGEGTLVLTTRAEGRPDDVLRHTWEIVPAGEMRVLTKTSWVEGRKELALALDHGYRLAGSPKVVLERGYDDAVAAALDSLEPERQTSTAALADAYEASVRVERWALARPNPRHRALAGIAHRMGERALGRFWAFAELDAKAARTRFQTSAAVLAGRVQELSRSLVRGSVAKRADACPPTDSGSDALEIEPAPTPDVLPCWGAYVSDATYAVEHSGDPERIALAILALAEREHRAASATSLVEQLRTMVHLHAGGELRAASGLGERSSHAIVYAALLRAQRFGHSPASADVLFAQLAVLRDVTGGYGSSRATLAVLRAMLSSQLEGRGTTRARVKAQRGTEWIDRAIDVPESGDVVVPVPEGALAVWVETDGPGVVARFERPVLRLWSRPPPPASSPVSLDVVWPAEVKAGGTALLRLVVRHGRDENLDVDTRVPLPPGVTLAAPTGGAAQLQGVLAVRRTVPTTGSVMEIPMRFALAGTMTAPEANARLTRAPSAPAVAPARTISIRAR